MRCGFMSWWVAACVGPAGPGGPADPADVGGSPDLAGHSGSAGAGNGEPTSGDTDDRDPPPHDTDPTGPADTGPAAPCAGRTVGTAVGECAPDFTLQDVNGQARSLYALHDQVTVLDFSTMWCPHCKALAPELQALSSAHPGQGLRVITVLHEDVQGNPPDAADLRAWISAFGITHPVLSDPQAVVEAVYGGSYQPNVVLLDEDLVVRWRNTGATAAGAVGAAVEALLAGGTP